MGRALGERHQARVETSTILVLGMDCFFLTANGIESVESFGHSREESGIKSIAIFGGNGVFAESIVTKGHLSKCVF